MGCDFGSTGDAQVIPRWSLRSLPKLKPFHEECKASPQNLVALLFLKSFRALLNSLEVFAYL